MSLLGFLQIGCLIVFGLLLLVAAWQDVRTLHIADAVSAAIGVTFLAWALCGLASGAYSGVDLVLALACGVLLFGLGALAFAGGVLGGGDVKLLAASSLFAGPALLPDFVIVTSLVGGLLGVAILAGAPIGPQVAGDATVHSRLRRGLPYGPAIAAGGLWLAATLVLR